MLKKVGLKKHSRTQNSKTTAQQSGGFVIIFLVCFINELDVRIVPHCGQKRKVHKVVDNAMAAVIVTDVFNSNVR